MIRTALAAVLLGLGALCAPQAHADNIPSGTAGDTIQKLQDWGYNVMLNGGVTDAQYLQPDQKSRCQVLEIDPTVTGPVPDGQFFTVYVHLSCSPSKGGYAGGGTM
jgi:hypothetical protein